MGRRKIDRERINITLPAGMPEELSRAAAERGWDRSRLIEELAREFLEGWRKPPEGDPAPNVPTETE